MLVVLPAALQLGCGESAVKIRLLFPDGQALEATRRVEVVAMLSTVDVSCATVLGRRADELSPEPVSSVEITLPASADPVLPALPMKDLVIAAVALDSSLRVTYAGCTHVEAEPGETVEVDITLVACPSGNCTGCTVTSDCPSNLDCVSNACRCVENGRCPGCCKADVCYPGTTIGLCGRDGAACSTCTTPSTCSTASCSSGACQLTPKTDSTSCSGGRCHQGECCTQCWDGQSCVSGTTVTTCGSGGAVCKDCTQIQPCMEPICTGLTCTVGGYLPPGSPCPGGKCTSLGQCCPGCISGVSCKTGKTATYCGNSGESCEICPVPTGSECLNPTCPTGSCTTTPKPDGTVCTNGRCFLGDCCDGCWDPTSQVCYQVSDDYCGKEGGPCTDCTQLVPPLSCSDGTCQ